VYQGSPPDNRRYQPNGLAPQKLNWLGFWNTPIGLSEKHSPTLQDIDGDPPISQLLL